MEWLLVEMSRQYGVHLYEGRCDGCGVLRSEDFIKRRALWSNGTRSGRRVDFCSGKCKTDFDRRN